MISPRRLFGIALGALIAATSAGSCPAQQVAAAPAGVTVDNFAFEQATLTIARGTRVTWVNRDEEPHTVVAMGSNEAAL